jgi:putative DNA primase/helicase
MSDFKDEENQDINNPDPNKDSNPDQDTPKNNADKEPELPPIQPIEISDIVFEAQRCANVTTFTPLGLERFSESFIEKLTEKDFQNLIDKHSHEWKEGPSYKQLQVLAITQLKAVAIKNGWRLCKNNDQIYFYNGAFWSAFSNEQFRDFLKKATIKMGLYSLNCLHFTFQDPTFKQFWADSFLTRPESERGVVLINLLNGTFEITPKYQKLRNPSSDDFLTYQLPFAYDPGAEAPIFKKFLEEVLPDPKVRMVLAEYIACVFIDPRDLKLEKVLILIGQGANGKSVFFEIIQNLLGKENVSSFSLSSLTNEKGNYRIEIADKLLNYTSEISTKMNTNTFKQMASMEPVDARRLYCNPVILWRYARMMFNSNELPREVEHTEAFYRRFLIILFEKIIEEKNQDKKLATKIIDAELAGVFNWVLEGLHRLLEQKNFTVSEAIDKQVEEYRHNSNSVACFVEEAFYVKSVETSMLLKEVYSEYRSYCHSSGNIACSSNNFGNRLRRLGFTVERKNHGNVVYMKIDLSKGAVGITDFQLL